MYIYLVQFNMTNDQSPPVLGKCIFYILSIAVLFPEMTTELCSVFSYVLVVNKCIFAQVKVCLSIL